MSEAVAEVTAQELATKTGINLNILEQECSDDDLLALSELCETWEIIGRHLQLLMHLSIVCPTTPCAGRGGGKRGGLLDLTLKTRPRGGAIDTPFVSTEPLIWHAF